MAQQHKAKKKRFEKEDAELLEKVSDRLVTKETLMEKLAQHVQQVITDMSACEMLLRFLATQANTFEL